MFGCLGFLRPCRGVWCALPIVSKNWCIWWECSIRHTMPDFHRARVILGMFPLSLRAVSTWNPMKHQRVVFLLHLNNCPSPTSIWHLHCDGSRCKIQVLRCKHEDERHVLRTFWDFFFGGWVSYLFGSGQVRSWDWWTGFLGAINTLYKLSNCTMDTLSYIHMNKYKTAQFDANGLSDETKLVRCSEYVTFWLSVRTKKDQSREEHLRMAEVTCHCCDRLHVLLVTFQSYFSPQDGVLEG